MNAVGRRTTTEDLLQKVTKATKVRHRRPQTASRMTRPPPDSWILAPDSFFLPNQITHRQIDDLVAAAIEHGFKRP
jgi:hypothetical protein